MRRVLLNVITFFFLSACAQADDQGRDYKGVFDGLSVSSKYIDEIKLFDQMAFADDQETYVSAGVHKVLIGKGPKYIYQAFSRYELGTTELPELVRRNNFILQKSVFANKLNNSNEYNRANLFILKVSSLKKIDMSLYKELLTEHLGSDYKKVLQAEIKVSDEGRCGLVREVQDASVVNTIVFIPTETEANLNKHDMTKAMISCINRGHYYHFGFSNVIQLPAQSFVQWGEERSYFKMNSKYRVVFPSFFQDGSMAGKPRKEVLRALALKASR